MMNDILILRGNEVLSLLHKQEKELIRLVHAAYVAHAQGKSSLPHSVFINFPTNASNRIIALPAYLGANFELASVKWVSSFPDNISQGIERASAVVVLNSVQTGIPLAILEGSIISARRTAASAALAALSLQRDNAISCVGIIGCGMINFEILRFLHVVYPDLERLILFDTDRARALQFKETCVGLHPHLEVSVAHDISEVLKNCYLISIATNVGTPHIFNLSQCSPTSVLLHISLRDIAPEVLLTCDNVVDDVEHVLRAQTSLHRLQQRVGGTDYIRCNLADVLLEQAPEKRNVQGPTVFSPFGLGILDLAVSKFVYDTALEKQVGTAIPSFFPAPWPTRTEHNVDEEGVSYE